MPRHHGYCLLVLLALLFLATPGHADERILDYHADIALAADGSMTVTERIRVHSEGRRILHGIYRDFPTDYRDPRHHRYRVEFKLLSASRDGQPEPWHDETMGNGVRIYLGDAVVSLAPGEHEYVLSYRSDRQLGFFDDHDELFWNVTGTGWDFAIDHASAHVQLPAPVPPEQLRVSGYTGRQGSLEQALTARTETGGAGYATTRPLAPHEGLSIALSFPKGVIAEPGTGRRLQWLLKDNLDLLTGLLGLILLWIYYGLTWIACGRDPDAGVRVPGYEPPDGSSPAALRFVRRMGYDDTCFTAAILGLAAKGALDIDQDAGDTWSVTRNEAAASALTPDERSLHDALFRDSRKLSFVPSAHSRVSHARQVLQNALDRMYRNRFFVTNTLKLLPGLLISLITFLVISAISGGGAGFIMLWLTFWSIPVSILLTKAWLATRDHEQGSLFWWLIAIPFSGGEVIGLIMLGHLAGYAMLPVFVALLGTNIAFYSWMKAPTQLGAKLLNRIEGFRWYLGVAEKQELDSRYRPESRPELFASYLPYAVALDVGNAWAQRFAEALSPAQLQQAQPGWYRSVDNHGFDSGGFTRFSSGLSSGIGSAIASASVSPGSGGSGFSSSSSGGSGGGGGGGGGGGW